MGVWMGQAWYVLRSKPHKEAALNRYALQQGHHVFYPRIPVNPVNPRARKVRPYFPGYLFVQADLDSEGRSIFHWMPFSQGLVRVGGEPASVAPSFMTVLQDRLARIWDAGGLKLERFRPGDQVDCAGGDVRGLPGDLRRQAFRRRPCPGAAPDAQRPLPAGRAGCRGA